jgi:hypothetical protein
MDVPDCRSKCLLTKTVVPIPTHISTRSLPNHGSPPEIRASIFEFALLLPRTGVWYDLQDSRVGDANQSGTLKAYAADRDLSSSMSRYLPSHWDMHKDSPCQPGGDAKALFRATQRYSASASKSTKKLCLAFTPTMSSTCQTIGRLCSSSSNFLQCNSTTSETSCGGGRRTRSLRENW